MAGEWDTFRSRAEQVEVSAKAVAGQLGAEQGAHLRTKGALAEALKVAEASRIEALAFSFQPWTSTREASAALEASFSSSTSHQGVRGRTQEKQTKHGEQDSPSAFPF